jgi:hypothetical protein
VNGSVCDNCQKDIGLLSIMKAGTPNRIKCPHCKVALKYCKFPKAVLFFVGFFSLIPSFLFMYLVQPAEYVFLIFVSIAFITSCASEYFAAKYLIKNHELRLK